MEADELLPHETVTHRELQELVCRWMLQQDWCQAAAVEVNSLDVFGVSMPRELRARRQTPFPKPRLVVAEVKRTRSDLLTDLRAGKMLGYAKHGSHMYLAATEHALAWGRGKEAVLEDLAARGVPKSWGILRLWRHRWSSTEHLWHLSPVRHCRGGGTLYPTDDRLYGAMARLAQSLSYRVLRDAPEVTDGR